MSHEIRTPMNGVLGMLDLVIRSGLPQRQHDFLTLARSSAETLLRLLNDILDFSKIEAGRLDLESTPFNIRDVVGDSLKSLALPVYEKGLELSCSIALDVPEVLFGDPGRLSQVVGNLIGNARKFTERGEIEVRVEVETRDDASAMLHFAVRDTGIGIPPEKQQLIFAPFTQADSTTTRQYGGTGLGLAICAHLAEKMGGRIWLESQVGEGSTFHFSARYEVHDDQMAPGASPRIDLQGLPVLVVDDNPTQRIILDELLRGWGMKPALADCGEEAIRAMTQARDAGEPYALVLLDVLMPGMDGFAVAEWIQRDPELAGTAVMLLSAADLRSDSERCAALGLSVFLRKPFKASELFDSVLKVVGIAPTSGAQTSSTEGLPEPTRRLHVLLAEDTPVNQRLAVAILEDRGHTAYVANDGQEAIDLFSTNRLDLILMDVQMPRMDGFQATAAIRTLEAETGRHIPIIAMTAHAMKGDCERCLAAGMDGYISKPIRVERFLSVVEGWILPPERTLAHGVETERPTEAVFDPERALARAMGKRPLLTKLGKLFLAHYPDVLTEIDAALFAGDPRRLERAGHSLKSSACSICADRVAMAAERLEEIGRGGDIADAEPACARLRCELIDFDEALRKWEEGDEG
jgi:two-component system sensor histidine kinase/response regulator